MPNSRIVTTLREREQVALVVVISELGLSNNIRLAEQVSGVDVILSSDMHEITREPVLTSTNTLIAEVGQDGQVAGELNLTVDGGRIANWKWTLHHIDDHVRPDAEVAKLVAEVRKPFLAGPQFHLHVNPFSGTRLTRPLDTVVGRTKVALHRMNFANQEPAAVIEVKDENGRDLDAVDVVTRYLAQLPRRTTAPQPGRLKLVRPVPTASSGSPEIQPWHGAVPSTVGARAPDAGERPSRSQQAN
jgi:hypothetical protein